MNKPIYIIEKIYHRSGTFCNKYIVEFDELVAFHKQQLTIQSIYADTLITDAEADARIIALQDANRERFKGMVFSILDQIEVDEITACIAKLSKKTGAYSFSGEDYDISLGTTKKKAFQEDMEVQKINNDLNGDDWSEQ